MATTQLKSDDRFLVYREGKVGDLQKKGYFKLEFEKLKDELSAPIAVQKDELNVGIPGLMYPGPTLRYEADGELNVDFPTSLRFVDVLTSDYQQPLQDVLYVSGDFYLVSIGINDEIYLSAEHWSGIDGEEYLSVNSAPKAAGNNYRANTGLYVGFGGQGNTEVDLINHTSDIASGLLIDVNIFEGSMVLDTINIVNGGSNYVQDDVIEYKTTLSAAAPAYFRVDVGANGQVTGMEAIASPNTPEIPLGSETAGFGYLMPLAMKGKISAARTRSKTGYGQGLLVDVDVENGQITNVSLSYRSQHNNYVDKETLVVYDGIDREGDGLIEVSVDSDNAGYVICKNGDKVIYKGSTSGQPDARWIHVPQNADDQTLLGLVQDYRGIVNDPKTGDYEYFNSEYALTLGKDTAARLGTIAIKCAHYEFNQNNTINTTNSYAGFITPQEKHKLSTVSENATAGDVNAVFANPFTDPNNGQKYQVIDVTTEYTNTGDEVTLDIKVAETNKYGVVSVIKSSDIPEAIVTRGSGAYTASDSVVANADQLVEFFMPRNISSLRKLY